MDSREVRRWRAAYGRLLELLVVEDRTALVQAEIVHTAAHLAEHSREVDRQLDADGGVCPRAEETAPTA